jgi:hypothetical protein
MTVVSHLVKDDVTICATIHRWGARRAATAPLLQVLQLPLSRSPAISAAAGPGTSHTAPPPAPPNPTSRPTSPLTAPPHPPHPTHPARSPTSYCFSLFDRMMMLVRGRVVFFGDQGKSAIDWAHSHYPEIKPFSEGAPRRPGVGMGMGACAGAALLVPGRRKGSGLEAGSPGHCAPVHTEPISPAAPPSTPPRPPSHARPAPTVLTRPPSHARPAPPRRLQRRRVAGGHGD